MHHIDVGRSVDSASLEQTNLVAPGSACTMDELVPAWEVA
jgi:hypothetical protein